jgi:7-carboxy-7-deazaguanine synthase
VPVELNILYPVMEHFYTIQGEGKHSGRAAYFIRLGGCDVGCVWCDVKDSWEADKHPKCSVSFLLDHVQNCNANLVVITGGEPAMHDLTPLIHALKSKSIEVAIETSGAHKLIGEVDWYTFSPKKFKNPVDEAYLKANELKVVIYHASDLKWAEEHAKKVQKNCLLYLQPEWSKRESISDLIVEYVKLNPYWKISLQTHKFIDIP